MTKMSSEDRIKQATIAIMRHKTFCAFSGVVACGKVTVTDKIKTAATDGWNTVYNPDFVAALSDAELRFLILHEAVHKAYRHHRVWKHLWMQDAKRTNVAADIFVNTALTDTDNGEGFIAFPSVGGVPAMPKYRGWSVGQIFDDLQGQGQGQGQGEGMDDHDWSEEPDEKSEQERAVEIDRALRQGEMLAKKRGDGTGNSSAMVGELLAPRVDWKSQLREFIQETCQGRDESTWKRPNRRFIGDDIYMPSMHSERIGELVVGWDTSGSCFTGTVIDRVASELAAIVEQVKPSKVRLILWDSEVLGEQVFEDGQFAVSQIEVKGGGGTDGSVLFDYLREKQIRPQAIVQITDGEVGSWGTTDVPTLWGILDNKHITAPYGTTIHIEV